MRLRLLVAPLLVAAAGDLQAEVVVRLVGDRVSVRAEAASLSEVLERLAERTGMKVVWEKNLGRPNVTATLENCTQAEAVQGLLQGSGFNYALTLDPTGARVETLMIVGVPGRAPEPGVVHPRQAEPPDPAAEEWVAEAAPLPRAVEPPSKAERPRRKTRP